jgi:ER-bound oxygenase mpaB/B'/Rubber oxygenase, catalytic domain
MRTTARVKPTRVFSDELLTRYRQEGDPPADAAIAAVLETAGRAGLGQLMQWLGNTADFDVSTQPVDIQVFFAEYAKLPTWADATRMQRGMVFFQQNAGLIGLSLGTCSLPYTYLGADGVRVLAMTERIKNDTTRRLQETGEWVFAVNDPKRWSSQTGQLAENNAIAYTLKIRLIHAAVRQFVLASGQWNMAWGYPVNQEDMAGTNLSFSYIVLRALRKMDVPLTDQAQEDYLHHINVLGWLNGVNDDLIAHNLREAFSLDKAIAKRQFRASEGGKALTNALLNAVGSLASQANGANNQSGISAEQARNLAAGQMRFLLGEQHADWLGIPAVPAEKRLTGLVSRLPIFAKLVPASQFTTIPG